MSLSIALPNGFTNVSSAGTPVPLFAGNDANRLLTGRATLLLTARQNKTTANTGDVYVGNRSAQNQVLTAGQSISLEVYPGEQLDLSQIFIDAANNGDGVSWLVKRV